MFLFQDPYNKSILHAKKSGQTVRNLFIYDQKAKKVWKIDPRNTNWNGS